jgi:hypothetical protein
MEPNVFMGYPKWGIACLVSPYGHEIYPYNTMDQKIQPMVLHCSLMNGLHSFKVLLGYAIPLQVSKDMIWRPNYFKVTQNGVLHVHLVFCFMNLSTTYIKCIYIEWSFCIVLIIHLVCNTPMENIILTKLAIPLYKVCQTL